jgi:hypothetical protein
VGVRTALIALLLLLPGARAGAQQFIYLWSGPGFSATSGTVLPGSAVTGALVLQGPVENLPMQEVTPVSFSFSAGPVTIDDGTPLHPFTTIQVQTDASGEIVDAVIQLVEEGDASAMGGGLFAADVICVGSCDGNDARDLVIDRNETANVIGMGEVAVAGSFWSSPQLAPAAVPALPALGAGVLASVLAVTAFARLRGAWGRSARSARGASG